jgi:glucose-6-phosphate isomerase
MPVSPSPFTVSIDATTGVGQAFADHYVKYFRDVRDIFEDAAAAASIDGDSVAYEVFSSERTRHEGELVFGTSVLMPGLIGDEFMMTRGHVHEIVDRAEVYYCLSGEGVMLMEDDDGHTIAELLAPGDAVYVPGRWIHRSVNTGDQPLVTLFCFASDAGQDYSIIDRSNGMARLVVTDGAGGWQLRENLRYMPRHQTDGSALGTVS